jgi:hypothetical protein
MIVSKTFTSKKIHAVFLEGITSWKIVAWKTEMEMEKQY